MESDDSSNPDRRPLLIITSVIFLVILSSYGQSVIRQIELLGWEETEGTVTTYDPYNQTFWYNYSVGGTEYSEWRSSFSWDEQATSFAPVNKYQANLFTNRNTGDACTKNILLTLHSNQIAHVHIHSPNASNNTFPSRLRTIRTPHRILHRRTCGLQACGLQVHLA